MHVPRSKGRSSRRRVAVCSFLEKPVQFTTDHVDGTHLTLLVHRLTFRDREMPIRAINAQGKSVSSRISRPQSNQRYTLAPIYRRQFTARNRGMKGAARAFLGGIPGTRRSGETLDGGEAAPPHLVVMAVKVRLPLGSDHPPDRTGTHSISRPLSCCLRRASSRIRSMSKSIFCKGFLIRRTSRTDLVGSLFFVHNRHRIILPSVLRLNRARGRHASTVTAPAAAAESPT